MTSESRYRSLDGLRGVAALIVLMYHAALINDRVAATYLTGDEVKSNAGWFLTYTPLHAVWAGREAVLVFFVLSGFVLAVAAARGVPQHWRSYYPRRLVRLYLPAIGSLIFAWITVMLVAREMQPGASPWLNQHASEDSGLKQVILGSTLLHGGGGLNTPLWSLKWELLFSLLLPLYLWIGFKLRKAPLVAVALCIVVSVIGARTGWVDGALIYMPVFGIGVVMAYNEARIRKFAGRLSAEQWALVVAALVALLGAHWSVGLATSLSVETRASIAETTGLLAIVLVVFLAGWAPAATKFLTLPALHWLGRVSFSLYLVHEPLVVAFGFLTEGSAPLWLTYVVCVPVALAAAEAFYLLVERPAHRLSRRVGHAFRPNPAVQAAD